MTLSHARVMMGDPGVVGGMRWWRGWRQRSKVFDDAHAPVAAWTWPTGILGFGRGRATRWLPHREDADRVM